MAATPSKLSPSNRTPAEEAAANKDDTAAANSTSDETAVTASKPSYDDSQKSDFYQVGTTLMKSGDFDQALSMIEEGINETQSKLMSMGIEDCTFHEALAPFNYLYGTTLLYSIEESSADQAMTTIAASGANGEGSDPSPEADETEIAWECLETARAALEKLVEASTGQERVDKLKVDLAQVLLREGDLERLNGRYDSAVNDYASCLRLREESSLVGPYDRKIADAHYNLGLVYGLLVAESNQPNAEEQVDGRSVKDENRLPFLRGRFVHHNLMCAKALCGQIAFLCDTDPAEFIRKAEEDIPKFKTTGEEELGDDIDHPKVASLKLQSLRKHVEALQTSSENEPEVKDLNELLIEIQETVDEAENAERGVHEVTEMKKEISAAVSSGITDGIEAGEASSSTPAFGSSAAAASTAVAQPIMAVKKKKKRSSDESEAREKGPEAKRANVNEG